MIVWIAIFACTESHAAPCGTRCEFFEWMFFEFFVAIVVEKFGVVAFIEILGKKVQFDLFWRLLYESLNALKLLMNLGNYISRDAHVKWFILPTFSMDLSKN